MDILTFNAVKQQQHHLNTDLLDPWKRPAFAVVTMYSSSPWGTILYNHYLQEVGRQNYNSTSYMQGTTGGEGTEFFNNWYSYGQTNSNISSTDSSYGDNTARCGHLGHISLAVAPDGSMIGRAAPYAATALRNVGVWVNNKTNKNLALFMENQYAGVAPRAIAPGRLSGTEGWHLAWTANKFYAQNDFGTYNKYGMIGYNEKTRTLVINENTNGGTGMRLHVYSNVAPFDIHASDRKTWFDALDEDNHTFFDWTANSAGYSESLYRAVVVPCDDGKVIIVRMEPHSYCMLDRFTPDGAGGFTQEATHTLSTTTSYGMEQGDRNGLRFQISNDGKYVICYQPYYYYGAGAEVFLIRVSDGKYVFLQHQDSSYGRSFAPIRDSDFMISYSPNSDSGYGIYMSHIDTKSIFEAIADKGDMSSKVPGFNVYIFDSAYHSTNYPYIVPIIGGNYGAGLAEARMDLQALTELDQTWSARGDTFDGVFDSTMTVWEALIRIARCGRAVPVLQGGVVRLFRDAQQTLPVAMFSPRNIVKGSFKIQYIMPGDDTADAVTVEFFNSRTWNPDEVTSSLPDSAAQKPAKVMLFGCTNEPQAKREGLYMAADNRYRRKLVSWQTELDGLIPTYGDLVAVTHDMPRWGQGGEVVSWDPETSILEVSEPLDWSEGVDHYIALRRRDGSPAGPFKVQANGDDMRSLRILDALDFVPYTGTAEERSHFAFGPGEAWSAKARVIAVRPRGELVEITAVGEDVRVHEADLAA